MSAYRSALLVPLVALTAPSDASGQAGRTIDQPSVVISGASDWGIYQAPGALERMQEEVCTDMCGVHLVDGAGHWVQQEQHGATSRLLIDFLREIQQR